MHCHRLDKSQQFKYYILVNLYQNKPKDHYEFYDERKIDNSTDR